MNIAKTNVMIVDSTPINLNTVLIENVEGYVYLGQHHSLKGKKQDTEMQRRIMAGWAAFAKHRDIFKSNVAICLTDRRTSRVTRYLETIIMIRKDDKGTSQARRYDLDKYWTNTI